MLTNRSAPAATVVPVLVYDDVAKAVTWLCRAFGFTERLRYVGRDGWVTHAQLAIAEGAIMLGARGGEFRPPTAGETSQYVVVHVDDVDAHCERAKQAGARVRVPPATQPFGERQYSVEDIGGHRWTFSQHVADVAPADWGAIATTVAPE
jgi:uncharacterized glyoxalase superfamily protein PhnB